MISYDVGEMARNILMPSDTVQEVREQLVRQLVCAAVEIFNDPHRENSVIVELEDVLENDYEVVGAGKLVLGMVAEIRQRALTSGWDSRTKAKIEYKHLGRAFNRALVVMDLDETVARMLADGCLEPAKEHVTDIVSDHPDLETLNELNTLQVKQTRRGIPLLSDRAATFVREPETVGWRTRDWLRFGRN